MAGMAPGEVASVEVCEQMGCGIAALVREMLD
jgi:hypothetical protein